MLRRINRKGVRPRRLLGSLIVVLSLVGRSTGFEAEATLRKIDVDKRLATVFAGGRERTVAVNANAKMQDEGGKDLSGGLEAEQLKPGAAVTLKVERVGTAMAIVSIRRGGRDKAPARIQNRHTCQDLVRETVALLRVL